jgi:hypothetical protein
VCRTRNEEVVMIVAAEDYPLLDLMWTFLVFFAFVAWFMLLFRVFGDLFRRDDIGGWGKTGWTLFVIFLPFLGVFAYLIAEGRKMADRDQHQARVMKQQTDDYIRAVAAGDGRTANGHSSVDDIARGKQLLDSGAITEEEFAQIKRQALVA